MDDLPDEAAIELGRITYFAGHADSYLELLVPGEDEKPRRRGLSGKALKKNLAVPARSSDPLREILEAYGPMYERRNVLIHGSHHYRDGVLWTWFVPQRGKGNTVRSFQHRLQDLRDMADSWQRLAAAAHELTHAS